MTEFIGFAYASIVAAGGVIGYVRAGNLIVWAILGLLVPDAVLRQHMVEPLSSLNYFSLKEVWFHWLWD